VPRRAPRRIPHKKSRRKPLGWQARLAIAGCGLIFAVLAWAAIARALAPRSNTSLTRFDAIVVLGTPADGDGNPKPNQLARVTEAVHEYERGVAPRLILASRITLGVAWLVVVAAEMIAVNSGLGFLIIDARNAGNRYDLVVAGMIIIGLIGLLLDLAMRSLERLKFVRWGYSEE